MTERGYIMCTKPLKAIYVANNENGNKVLRFIKREDPNYHTMDYQIEIPCGRCVECRLEKSREWANRMILEMPYHSMTSFITLTYDDDHLPRRYVYDDKTKLDARLYDSSLVKRDLQLFIKRLRFSLPDVKISYYACGEYGDQTHRPHYHIIIFGYQPDDLKLYKITKRQETLYTSASLQRIWNKGYVIIGNVSWDSCRYVAGYVQKKLYGKDAEIYEQYNIVPPFSLMSLKPTIGKRYYDDHKHEIMKYDEIFIKKGDKVLKVKPPKYYKRLYKQEYPDLYNEYYQDSELKAIDNMSLKLNNTSKSYMDYNKIREQNLQAKTNVLKRKEI